MTPLMRFLPQVLCLVGVLAVLFGYWGINTQAGRRAFDEMAGMIPMAVGALGLLLIAVGIGWMLVRWRS